MKTVSIPVEHRSATTPAVIKRIIRAITAENVNNLVLTLGAILGAIGTFQSNAHLAYAGGALVIGSIFFIDPIIESLSDKKK